MKPRDPKAPAKKLVSKTDGQLLAEVRAELAATTAALAALRATLARMSEAWRVLSKNLG